jgi:hypothetical protein
MEKNIPKHQLEAWKDMVQKWDSDHTQPDPYVEPEASTRELLSI